MKRVIKYFSLVLFCSLFMLLSSFSSVEANYDAAKNTARVSVNKNEVKITVTYQRGFDISELTYYKWCVKQYADSSFNPECDPYDDVKVAYAEVGRASGAPGQAQSYISQADAKHADSDLTSHTFTVSASNDAVLKKITDNYNGQMSDTYFYIVVSHYFCSVRSKSGNEYPSCEVWDGSNVYTTLSVNSNDLIHNKTVGNVDLSDSISNIDDTGMEDLMKKISDIVNNTVLPIIWVALGLFLVVKGSLLGVQIVKAADEPQVRQEKIGSLKWMVIGVAISYGASFVVGILLKFFSGAFSE